MDSRMICEATEYLNSLNRIDSIDEAKNYSEDVLLLPKNIEIIVDTDSNIITSGLDKEKKIKAKDLLRIIQIEDSKTIKYTETNVFSPSVYVHSLPEKPWHITTQAFLVTRIGADIKEYIKQEELRQQNYYRKHEMDYFWLTCSKPLDLVTSNDLVCIFNRRVSGWDGAIDRPVIELLGAGGHLQAIWDDTAKCFKNRSFESNLKKEFSEEIGLSIKEDDMKCIGGFTNSTTQELVVFYCIFIEPTMIPAIQLCALNNIAEDTDGIYLGTFSETIDYYRKRPQYFAGGEKAAKTNFPNNSYIVGRICDLFHVDS